jgi:pimeloyl-ACP methyl ester carboxylesterase
MPTLARRVRRICLALPLLLSVIVSTAGAPAPAAPAAGGEDGGRHASPPPVPELAWRPCGPGLERFDCATVAVPLDYDDPAGPTTTLALTRLPASDPARRIGTLFVNPGGPGGSGVDIVQQAADVLVTAEVRARFDLLGFDPRGVGRSDPATCFPREDQEIAFMADDLIFPVGSAQERRFTADRRSLARSCAATSPDRFSHGSTANVARDLDLLRRAVGDTRLNYLGYSYGTFLGATYAALFPDRIRAMVLDGTIDPRSYVGRGARLRQKPIAVRIGQTRGGAEVFGEFVRLCRAGGPAACSLAGLGDPAVVTRRTLDALKRRPVQLPLPDGSTIELTYQLMVAVTYSTLYSPTEWPNLADLYVAVALRSSAGMSRAASGLAAVASLREQDYPSVGGSLASLCVDALTPSPEHYPRLADVQDRRYPDFGRFRTWIDVVCSQIRREGIRDAGVYRGPWRQRTRAHVLVLGTRWDPATPYRSTRPYAELFRHASVLTLEGWGHTAIAKSRCVDAHLESYLIHPARSDRDHSCAPDEVPFAASRGRTGNGHAGHADVVPALRPGRGVSG